MFCIFCLTFCFGTSNNVPGHVCLTFSVTVSNRLAKPARYFAVLVIQYILYCPLFRCIIWFVFLPISWAEARRAFLRSAGTARPCAFFLGRLVWPPLVDLQAGLQARLTRLAFRLVLQGWPSGCLSCWSIEPSMLGDAISELFICG